MPAANWALADRWAEEAARAAASVAQVEPVRFLDSRLASAASLMLIWLLPFRAAAVGPRLGESRILVGIRYSPSEVVVEEESNLAPCRPSRLARPDPC